MRSELWAWLCIGLVGCFAAPPEPTVDGTTSGGGSSSSGVDISAGATTSVITTISPTSDAASSSSSEGSASSSSSEGESSSGDPELCPGAGICFPPAPMDWDGPAIVMTGLEEGEEPMCPPGAEVLWRAGTDPAAPCDCSECGGAIGCEVGLGYGANGFCEGETNVPGCQPFSSELTGQFATSFSISVSDGAACVSPDPGEPGFRERTVGCAPNAEPCDDGICLLGPACISRPGEHECPADYDDRSVLYMEATGSGLSCDTCGCGDANSAFFCSEATVALYETEDCLGEPMAEPQSYQDGAACLGYFSSEGIVLIDDIMSVNIDIPPADCTSGRVSENASGDFVETGPRTVCCSG